MFRSVRCISVLSLIMASVLTAGEPINLPQKEKFKIFLLIGQSNMAGRGKVEDQDKMPHPRVLTLTKDDKWKPAIDPIHFDKPAMTGVGLGTNFGKTIAETMPDAAIGLVPCAVGGTAIAQWKKDGALYKEALRRAKLALKDGTLAGILWHQGEADVSHVATYPDDAAKLFADLRADLGAPNVPVVAGTLGEFKKGVEGFNAMLRKLPEKVPNSACADSKGLGHKGDNLHFDSAGLREFGKRYAAEWLKLAKSGK